jgi:hypothetical protein
MAARLGNVLYWVGCGVSAIVLILAVILVTFSWSVEIAPTPPGLTFGHGDIVGQPKPLDLASFTTWHWIVLGMMAVGPWLVGRAVRYVLAGR